MQLDGVWTLSVFQRGGGGAHRVKRSERGGGIEKISSVRKTNYFILNL